VCSSDLKEEDIMNLLGMKRIMKMKGKKKTKTKVFVNTETKINMKKIIEANAKLNMKVKMNVNVKVKLNTILQMGMRCCRFAGYLGDQIKAAGADRTAARRRSPRLPSRMKLR
jgi:hypothetical protein